MKVAVYTRYGPPDVVQIKDIGKPVPRDDEVLIKVRAASVNPAEWHLMEGKPSFARLLFGLGLLKPKDTRLGHDVAGQVETVGKDVTQFNQATSSGCAVGRLQSMRVLPSRNWT